MDIMTNRVIRLLNNIESDYSNLSIVEKTYGYYVSYIDSLGYKQEIDIYKLNLKRSTYIVRWITNDNMKLRLPAYKGAVL